MYIINSWITIVYFCERKTVKSYWTIDPNKTSPSPFVYLPFNKIGIILEQTSGFVFPPKTFDVLNVCSPFSIVTFIFYLFNHMKNKQTVAVKPNQDPSYSLKEIGRSLYGGSQTPTLLWLGERCIASLRKPN